MRFSIPTLGCTVNQHDDLAACVQHVVRWLADRRKDCLSVRHSPQPVGRPADIGRIKGRKNTLRGAHNRSAAGAVSHANSIRTRRAAAVKRNVPGTAGLGPIDRFDGAQPCFGPSAS
jgi:hypothetical protein